MRKSLAAAVLALCVLNASATWLAPAVRYRTFFPDAWHDGERAAAKNASKGYMFLADPRLAPAWHIEEAEAEARARESARLRRAPGTSSGSECRSGDRDSLAGSYEFESRLWVLPRFSFERSAEQNAEDAAWVAAHDRHMRRAAASGEPNTHLGPARVPAVADVRAAFERTEGVADLDPGASWRPRPGGPYVFRSDIGADGTSRYGILGPYGTVFLRTSSFTSDLPTRMPFDGRVRFALDEDGVTLYAHDLAAGRYWCIDTRMGCIVTTMSVSD